MSSSPLATLRCPTWDPEQKPRPPRKLDKPQLRQFDPFTREDEGVRAMTEMVTGARARGARWSMIAAEKGHEDGAAFDIYLKLVEQAIATRYPADADPAKGPVALKSVAEESGWLADTSSWGSGITQIADYQSYNGDRSKA